MEYYQDVFVKGQVIRRGVRECDGRYQAISNFCRQYQRPITVLDIGANFGYFTFRLANDFDGTFVAVEGGEAEKTFLADLCRENADPKVVLLNKRLSLADLKELGKVECFDMVLALSVLHHFNESFPEVFDAMRRLGRHLIVEMPDENENAHNQQRVVKERIEYEKYAPILLTQTPTHTRSGLVRDTVLFDCGEKTITKPYWGWIHGWTAFEPPVITSTFEKKEVVFKRKDERREWIDGINFSTYLALNGVYPTTEALESSLQRLDAASSSDLRQWNMILSRGVLKLIDRNDRANGSDSPAQARAYLSKITQLFKANKLPPNRLLTT